MVETRSPRNYKKDSFKGHFDFFKDPAFKRTRAQCHYCHETVMNDLQRRKNHLAKCLHLPKKFIRPSPRPLKKSPSNLKTCCRCCASNIPLSEYETHPAGFNFTKCEGCRKSKIPKSKIKAHEAACNFIRCSRCRKRIVKSEYEVHKTDCNFKACFRCNKTKIPISEYEAHNAGCNFKQCSRCHNKKIPKPEMKAHYAICNFEKCSRCNQARIPKSEFEAHKAGCDIKRCSRCIKSIPKSEMDAHKAVCDFKRCSKCNKTKIPPAEFVNHRKECGFRRCQGCGRMNIPLAEFDHHLDTCPFRCCRRCKKIKIPAQELDTHHATVCLQFQPCRGCLAVIPVDSFIQHLESCPYRRCVRCGKAKISVQDAESHQKTCEYSPCRKCRSRLHKDEVSTHICNKAYCPVCQKKIPLDQFAEHVTICQCFRCQVCMLKLPTSSALDEHQCGASRPKRGFYRNPEGLTLFMSVDYNGNSSSRSSEVSNPQLKLQRSNETRKKLLSAKTTFPQTPSMQKIRREWFGNPHATIILDFEYHSELLRVMKEEAVFKVAIANARGYWIVPQTSMNHRISTLELHRKAGTLWATAHKKIAKDDLSAQDQSMAEWGRWTASILKFYGHTSSNQTPGLTWQEITAMIREYTKKHGKLTTILEWSKTNGDYRCLQAGLEKGRSLDLLPRLTPWPERPIAWFCALRQELRLQPSDLSLSLGSLHHLIFPEKEDLFAQWHNAGPDVIMTIQLIEFYFRRMTKNPVAGKLESYFAPNLSDGQGQGLGSKAAHKYRSSEPQGDTSLRSHVKSDDVAVLSEQDLLEMETDDEKEDIWNLDMDSEMWDSDVDDEDLESDADDEDPELDLYC